MKNILLTLVLLFSVQVLANTVDREESIALNLEKEQKINAASTDAPLKTIATLVVLFLMGAGGFVWIKKSSVGSKNTQNQIKVLTQFYLGPKKSLAIVRVAGESVLIGITDQNINMIKSLSLLDEDIPESVPKDFLEEFNVSRMSS